MAEPPLAASTLGEALRQARAALAAAGVADPALDARLLVAEGAGVSREAILLGPERPLDASAAKTIAAMLKRRLGGEPVHRILGWREFYGLKLKLSPATLEPRPDTEALVDAVLPFIRETADRVGVCRILDLGTGTGAIALALISQEPRAVATGVDLSEEALRTADENAWALGLDGRFKTLRSDWFGSVAGRCHWIVANPPYISGSEKAALAPEVARFDPDLALFGGPDGLDAYRVIARDAGRFLEPDGGVAVEIGAAQKAAVEAIFESFGFTLTAAARDLGGRDRALVFSGKTAAPGLA
ncbi:MAG TPA: peptide chain release factor N(5)-glutamine methyltransferase [Mesorhizobium sp.]|jgi:release factor glutamine methyltransferase|nr:peptide chain release factor N(5)-glutamine methyltransferase [Mesorhizobium sp.]